MGHRICHAVGIINVTPDSFSGDGLLTKDNSDNLVDNCLGQAQRFIDAGCTFLDVGGESTRPGFNEISQEEELKRTIPVIDSIKKQFPDISVAIDTTKSHIAERAIEVGADTINDISAMQQDKNMTNVIREAQKDGVKIVLMHNSSSRSRILRDKLVGSSYESESQDLSPQDTLDRVISQLSDIVNFACDNGVIREAIMIDPGLGFGKTVTQNLTIIANIPSLIETFSLPIYIGASRKSFIGKLLNKPPEQRLYGSLSIASIAAFSGASYIRAHDVEETIQVIKIAEHTRRFKLHNTHSRDAD